MTTPEKAVTKVFARYQMDHAGEQTPIETAMAQAWFAGLEEEGKEDNRPYPFERVATEMRLTPREMIGAGLWVLGAGIVCGFVVIGMGTAFQWLVRWVMG